MMKESMMFSLAVFLSAGCKPYYYVTSTWLAHLYWLEQRNHLAVGLMKHDCQLYTEDECEAAFGVLARVTQHLSAKGEYDTLRGYWQNLPAIQFARKRMRFLLGRQKDIVFNEGLWTPSDPFVTKLEAVYKDLVDACAKRKPDLKMFPTFGPSQKSQPMNVKYGYSEVWSELDLKPYFTKDGIMDQLNSCIKQNIFLLGDKSYAPLLQEISPENIPIVPVPPERKTSEGDVIGYGWRFGDEVRIRTYGWGQGWYPVTGVQSEREDGEWANVWIVDPRELPDDVDVHDPEEFYHGRDDLDEYLVERHKITKVRRNHKWLEPDTITWRTDGQ